MSRKSGDLLKLFLQGDCGIWSRQKQDAEIRTAASFIGAAVFNCFYGDFAFSIYKEKGEEKMKREWKKILMCLILHWTPKI